LRFRSTIIPALCALPLAALAAAAQAPQPADTSLPAPVGWVNDFAHVISPGKGAQIEAVIREVNARCGGSIVVVTLPTLGGRSRDEVALQLGRRWKVGHAGEVGDTLRGTGAVVLVVPAEHQWKIELGTRTNTFVTAAQAGEIGREQMVPAFREGDFGEGILRGVTALAQRYAAQYHFTLDAVPAVTAPAAQPAPPPPSAYPPVTFAPRPDDHSMAATVAWVMLLALVSGALIVWYRDRRDEDAYRIRPKAPRLRTTVVPPNPDAYRRRRKNPPLNVILQQEHGWGRSTGGGFGQSPPGGFGGSSGGFGFGSFGGGGGGGGGGFGGGGGGGGVDFGGGGDFSGGGAGGSW
jgi:uncharacterized protein